MYHVKKKLNGAMEDCTANTFIAVSEVELVYRSKVKASDRPQVKTAKEVYQVLLNSWDEDKIEYVEQFKILLLNRAHRVLGIFEVSTGGQSGTAADPKVIFTAALKLSATSIILAHNHPSGNLKPSHADEQFTRKLKEAGKLLDMYVVDHLVISKEGYYSFTDEGLL